jgi:hypothetical protein
MCNYGCYERERESEKKKGNGLCIHSAIDCIYINIYKI